MIDRTARRFGITPRHLVADSAYGSAANLAWLVKERQIEPHIPVFDKSNRTDGTFSRSDFVFDADRNHYTCPQGKLLVQFRRTYATPRLGITKDGTRLYRSSKSLIARAAPSRRSAARTRRSAKYRGTSTKTRAMSPEAWQIHRPTSVRVIAGRKSRCCSPISSASSVASDCAVRAARGTSSCSRPPPKT